MKYDNIIDSIEECMIGATKEFVSEDWVLVYLYDYIIINSRHDQVFVWEGGGPARRRGAGKGKQ